MSDKVIKIGMLRIELHLAFDGVGAAIWEDDDLLRPTKRTLRLSLNGKEMKTLVDGVNSFYANEQPVGPTPQPAATLCEDIEILLKHLDDYFSGVALESFKSRVRHALTAERKRAVLVDEVEVTRNKVIEDYRIVLKLQKHAGNCACALCTRLLEYDAALDAFDKGAV